MATKIETNDLEILSKVANTFKYAGIKRVAELAALTLVQAVDAWAKEHSLEFNAAAAKQFIAEGINEEEGEK